MPRLAPPRRRKRHRRRRGGLGRRRTVVVVVNPFFGCLGASAAWVVRTPYALKRAGMLSTRARSVHRKAIRYAISPVINAPYAVCNRHNSKSLNVTRTADPNSARIIDVDNLSRKLVKAHQIMHKLLLYSH